MAGVRAQAEKTQHFKTVHSRQWKFPELGVGIGEFYAINSRDLAVFLRPVGLTRARRRIPRKTLLEFRKFKLQRAWAILIS